MATLYKMTICGIRSFDGGREEFLQFVTPLTLIAGYNGSGKTTIIECLKYVTTGDFPPISKGAAFVHDPTLQGDSYMKGAVRLSMKTERNVTITALRALELTIKRTTRTVKTVENSLTYTNSGERTANSAKIAEIDQSMLAEFGVSKAILDNVIFCHQEESLWPLSEPSSLKKKFDEIFEAQKYTKAIDHIKVLRKNLNEKLGQLKLTEQHAKADKDKGDEVSKQIDQQRRDFEALKAQLYEIETVIQGATENWRTASDNYASFEAKVKELEAKRMEVRIKNESIQEARLSIGTYLKQSDEELQHLLETHQDRLNANEENQRRCTESYHELEGRIKQVDKELGIKRGQQGRLEAEKDHYVEQISRRQTIVRDSARRQKIHGYDGTLPPEKINEFIDKIVQRVQEQNATFQRAERDMKKQLDEVQQHLNGLNTRKSTLRSNYDNAKARVMDVERQMSDYTRKVDSFNIDEGTKARFEASLEHAQKQLSKANEDNKNASLEQQMQDTESRLLGLDERRSSLQNDLIKFNAQSQQAAKIDVLNKSMIESERSLETLRSVHGGRITSLLGRQWQPEELEEAYRSTCERLRNQLKEEERQQEVIAREHSQVEFKGQEAVNALSEKKTLVQQHETAVLAALGAGEMRDYPEVLNLATENREVCKSDVDNFQTLKDWYEKCVTSAATKDICRLCKRSFHGDASGKSKFVQHLKSLMSAEKLKEAQEAFDKADKDLESIRAVSLAYEAWMKLTTAEVPELQKQMERLSAQSGKLVEDLERHDRLVSERQTSLKEAEALSKTIQSMSRDTNEIKRCSQEIKELSQHHTQGSGGRGLVAIQTDIRDCDDQIRVLRASLSQIQANDRDLRAQTTRFDVEVRDAQARVKDAEHLLLQKNEAAGRVEELREQTRHLRRQMEQSEEESKGLGPQITQMQAKVDDIDSRWTTKQTELRGITEMLSEISRSIEAAGQDIIAFERKDGERQLRQCGEEMDQLERQKKQAEEELRKIASQITKLRDEKTNQAEHQRTVRLNIKYRNDRRALDALMIEIKNLENSSAEKDRDYWYGEADQWQGERNAASAKQAGITAQMGSKNEQMQQNLSNWEEFYKNARQEFQQAHIEVEATKAAVEDLGRYGSALDKAIMKYHSLKMEEINEVLKELWEGTYQGQDVDSIVIRSDGDSSTGTRRTYNYRVCMLKQGVEMDMRGRCSAGQKVLACILIRLALAECFGARCGVIALDEPTTNLDRGNIEALAMSLHDLIKKRRKQRGFQLIIITHDLEFLKHLRPSDFVSQFYRVSRNDRQKSVIHLEDVAQLGD